MKTSEQLMEALTSVTSAMEELRDALQTAIAGEEEVVTLSTTEATVLMQKLEALKELCADESAERGDIAEFVDSLIDWTTEELIPSLS